MPGFGLSQQPAPAQFLEVVHHRALADILLFPACGDGRFRVERVRQQREQHLGRILAHVFRHERADAAVRVFEIAAQPDAGFDGSQIHKLQMALVGCIPQYLHEQGQPCHLRRMLHLTAVHLGIVLYPVDAFHFPVPP